MKSRSFSQRYPPDHPGPKYGPLFRAIRELPCWLKMEGYHGRGHQRCGLGVQGSHTAHHNGAEDTSGLIPGCGAAHDLYASLGGSQTLEEFRAWLEVRGEALEEIGLRYVQQVEEMIIP